MSVLNLDDAKDHLNISGSGDDAELASFIFAAESAVAEKCGPLEPTSFTERVRGGGPGLVLRNTPVISLTSITPVGGTAYADLTLFDLDASAGVVEWGSGAQFATGRYDVVYDAGRATVPDNLLLGVKELLRHMWETQRGGSRRPGSRTSDRTADTLPSAGYAFPFRVLELIRHHIQVGND